MDASYKIQRGIHVHLIQFFMCPEFWVHIKVQFGHASFLGTDLLKFQMASYSNLDLIDFGVYITTTKAMQKFLTNQYGHNWEGSLNFEKVEKYLPYFKSAIQVPIYGIGIDV